VCIVSAGFLAVTAARLRIVWLWVVTGAEVAPDTLSPADFVFTCMVHGPSALGFVSVDAPQPLHWADVRVSVPEEPPYLEEGETMPPTPTPTPLFAAGGVRHHVLVGPFALTPESCTAVAWVMWLYLAVVVAAIAVGAVWLCEKCRNARQ
jgi:hypothetical protein